MVFIITSPFPFHFLYKLVQVTRWVPSRMAPGNLLRYTCKTHNSAESLRLSSCGFHVPSGVSETHWCFRLERILRDHLYLFHRERDWGWKWSSMLPRVTQKGSIGVNTAQEWVSVKNKAGNALNNHHCALPIWDGKMEGWGGQVQMLYPSWSLSRTCGFILPIHVSINFTDVYWVPTIC